ncbi:MAG: hypothetical protein LBU14_06440 [Candidatus Peribacteria bacterium]|jgi:hypothetical protein|nr:hypothetical protein [Candidatus Peribacteria bacterium]
MKKIYNFCEKVITLVLLVGIGIFGIFQVYAITTSQQIDTAATKIEQILR